MNRKSEHLISVTMLDLLSVFLFVSLLCLALLQKENIVGRDKTTVLEALVISLQEEIRKNESLIQESLKERNELESRLKDALHDRQILIDAIARLNPTIVASLPGPIRTLLPPIEPPGSDSAQTGKGPGKGGAGKPICDACKGFLLTCTMNEDRTVLIKVNRGNLDLESKARIPVIAEIDDVPSTMKFQDFKLLCERIFLYSKEHDCRFRIELYDNTKSKMVFKEMIKLFEDTFYVAKRW